MRAVQRVKQRAKAHLASVAHGRPSKHMQIVLLAGQDGASLSAAALAMILQVSGARVGVITQTYVEIAGERAQGSDNADVLGDAFRLHKLLAQMRHSDCGYVLIEVPPTMPEHSFIGVHPTLIVIRRCGDAYLTTGQNSQRAAQVQRLLALRPHAVVCNRDDPCYEMLRPFMHPGPGLVTFGDHERAECQIQSVKLSLQGSWASVLIDHQTEVNLQSVYTGKQGVYSMVAAAAAAYMLHVSIPAIEDGARRCLAQTGHMQMLPVDRQYDVVLDSAVTPEGIVENLETLSHFSKNRLLAVLGANLLQPPEWRPVIGEAVAENVDRIVVTDGDYAADESARAVRDQFLQGIVQAGGDVFTDEQADRQAAIGRAISIARRNDTIIILASPLRPYRQVGQERVAWADWQVVEQLLS